MTSAGATADRTVIGESFGEWHLERLLGEGGMGVVHLAARGQQRAALKAVKPGLLGDRITRRRLGREIAAGLSIDSPHVAAILDFDIEARAPFVAWQFVDGPTLADHIYAHGPLSGRELASLGLGLAAGIAAIADAGILHRDLKASNVLVSDQGPVIIDLGIAAHDTDVTLTPSGHVLGSPGWIAPEQLRGQPVLGATDVFGWGAVMHYAATGSPPFGHGSPAVIMYRITHGHRQPCPLVGPLGDLVGRTLATNHKRRPTPHALVANLAGILR